MRDSLTPLREYPQTGVSRFRAGLAAATAVIALATGPGGVTLAPSPAYAQSAARGDNNSVIRDVQETLNLLGFDAGPADGVMGDRTVTAIRDFQRQNDLPVTGRPDEALFRALVDAVNAGKPDGRSGRDTTVAQATPATGEQAPAPPAAVQTPAPAAAIDLDSGATLPRSTWRIIDANGANQVVRFEADGGLVGRAHPDFWKWRMEDGRVVIEYHNEMGGRVVRIGRFVRDDRIEGEASSSRDIRWTWVARRLY